MVPAGVGEDLVDEIGSDHQHPVSLRGARLLIGTESFSGDDLIRLHRSPDFPLPRKH